MALIVFALSSVVRAPLVPPLPTSDGIEINDLSSLGQDDWSVVLNIVGDLDVEQAAAAGIEIRPGDIESAVEQLTVAEQRELLRILQEEIGKSGD
jgi:hypothetical protein